jgi:integrase
MPFSLEEVFLFLNAVQKDFYNYYVVRFFTGMRTAEIDGLKWKHVDFANRKIMIRETWQNKQWVGPKTESSVRDIDMSKVVEEALLPQKSVTGNNELVFCAKSGSPLDYNNVSKRIWHPTLKKTGLAIRTPYQTRHTAATLWLASGENPEWVARQLGHSNTGMLFRVYSKFVPNLTRRDGSAFESMLNKKLKEYKTDTAEEK